MDSPGSSVEREDGAGLVASKSKAQEEKVSVGESIVAVNRSSTASHRSSTASHRSSTASHSGATEDRSIVNHIDSVTDLSTLTIVTDKNRAIETELERVMDGDINKNRALKESETCTIGIGEEERTIEREPPKREESSTLQIEEQQVLAQLENDTNINIHSIMLYIVLVY